LLLRHRWTVRPSLNLTRSATSSQCKSTCRRCDSPWSYLRVPLTRRAAAFMTRCSLSVTDLGALANTVLQKSTRVVTKAWIMMRPTFVLTKMVEDKTRQAYMCVLFYYHNYYYTCHHLSCSGKCQKGYAK